MSFRILVSAVVSSRAILLSSLTNLTRHCAVSLPGLDLILSVGRIQDNLVSSVA